MSVVESTSVELRCPVGPKALLAKIRQSGGQETYTSDNLLELSCRDCSRTAKKINPKTVRVLHRYNILGELVESIISES